MDTLQASLQGNRFAYAQPPWKIIHAFLNRLSQFPLLKVLIVVPFWRAAPWWPLLLRLFEPNCAIFFKKRCLGIFETPSRAALPAPRWDVIFAYVSGRKCSQPTTRQQRLANFYRNVTSL